MKTAAFGFNASIISSFTMVRSSTTHRGGAANKRKKGSKAENEAGDYGSNRSTDEQDSGRDQGRSYDSTTNT